MPLDEKPWSHLLVAALALASVANRSANAYSRGAPVNARPDLCDNMFPQHGGMKAQTSPSPYRIELSSPHIETGAQIKVEIVGTTEQPINGFLLLVRQLNDQNKEAKDMAFGSFSLQNGNADLTRPTASDPPKFKTFPCFGTPDSSITHAERLNTPRAEFYWTAPQEEGNYRFVATVVQSRNVFWMNVTRDIHVHTNHHGHREDQCNTSDATNTCSHDRKSEDLPINKRIEKACSHSNASTCFPVPTGCSSDCTMMAVITILPAETLSEEQVYQISLMGKPKTLKNGYISVGLSDDQYMGGDSVFGCYFNGTKVVALETLNMMDKWNRALPENVERSLIASNETVLTENYLICEFIVKRNINYVFKEGNQTTSIKLDLYNQSLYLLLARGSVKKPESFSIHPWDSVWVSGSPAFLGKQMLFPNNLLIKAHGSVLLVAWVLLASVGMFTARYYKHTFGEYKLFGKALWFVIHQSCMVTAVILTIIGIVLMIMKQGISEMADGADRAHPIVGFVLMGFAMLQIVVAMIRPDPSAGKTRSIFNWFHYLNAMLCYILAFASLFLAYYLKKSKLKRDSDSLLDYSSILITFLAFHVTLHFLMTVHTFLIDSKLDDTAVVSTKYRSLMPGPMKCADSQMDLPGSGFRTTLLLMEVMFATLATAYLVTEVCNG